jgi:class 3 adenylate cyclase
MDLQTRYCKTSDGVDIAYATHGEGPPLVISPNLLVPHLQMELNYAQIGAFFERLSRRVQVIRYDRRGTGMSQRDAIDFSADAGERDLLAVVDRLGLDRFALYTHIVAGDGPLVFASRHPDRVRSLVWWVGVSSQITAETLRQLDAVAPLMESEWELYTNVVGRLLCGWNAPEAADYGELVRAGSMPEARRAASQTIRRSRLVGYVSPEEVRVPTLVAHLSASQASTSAARTIASGIPMAHVIAIPGLETRLSTYVADNEVLIEAIADFVEGTAGDSKAPIRPPELQLSAMRAILWTDIVEHTPMMNRHGDAKGRELLREHERITRDELAAHGGTEVKAMGDGFMTWFSSAHRALDCAVALQRAFAARNAAGAEPLLIRAGLNAGEPIIEDDDLFGTSVIAASRICSQAAGGEIVVSDVVRQLVAGKGFLFNDRGAVLLKGFEDPVRLYEVSWRNSSQMA